MIRSQLRWRLKQRQISKKRMRERRGTSFLRIRRHMNHFHINLIFITQMEMARFFVAMHKLLIGVINSSTKNPLSRRFKWKYHHFYLWCLHQTILSSVFVAMERMSTSITAVVNYTFCIASSIRNLFQWRH